MGENGLIAAYQQPRSSFLQPRPQIGMLLRFATRECVQQTIGEFRLGPWENEARGIIRVTFQSD
jgi:hypothetical protein